MTILRQTIMDAIETRMKTILTTGGYYSNLGSNVFVFRPRLAESMYTPLNASELPAVIVRDGMAAYSEFTLGGKCRCDLSVELEVRCEDGSDSADTARKLIADVYAAIGTDPKWGAASSASISAIRSTRSVSTTRDTSRSDNRCRSRSLLRSRAKPTSARR